MSEDDHIELGSCCACQASGATVRNIMMLPFRAPVAGTGWGCVVCGLPSDGAIAVVCDACLESDAQIVHVCHGYPAANVRAPRASLLDPFDHDPIAHEGDQYL